jgi:LysM repeat protein
MEKKFARKLFISLFVLIILNLSLFADTSYKVEKGDTLYSISRKYQITVAELRAANNLSENDIIKIGQKLIIPTADISTAAALLSDNTKKDSTEKTNSDKAAAEKEKNQAKALENASSVYVVQKGDTLYAIARKCGLTVGELVSLNDIDTSAVIKVGQKLKIKAIQTLAQATPSDKSGSTSGSNKSPSDKNASSSSADKTPAKTQETKEDKTPDTRTYGITITSDSSTIWPVKNPKVTTVKGKASGVQLSAQKNEAVTCIREGTVMYVGLYRGFGQVVFVQSKTGIIYAYAGLGSVSVRKSEYLNFGTEIGTAGIDPISKNPQITFIVFQNGQPIDPAKAPRN